MAVREGVIHWLEQAGYDMETAEYLLGGGRLDAASFYAHQSLEKALKAYIMYQKKESPGHYHSLIRLARETDLPGGFHGILKEMTPEYYVSRYPDSVEDAPYRTYQAKDVKDKLARSREVLEWITSKIPK